MQNHSDNAANIMKRVQPHKEHLQTLQGWGEYRRKNPHLELPHSNTLKSYFGGTWKNVKEAFELDVKQNWSALTLTEAENILQPHINALKGTPIDWDTYRKEKCLEDSLPGSYPLIKVFKSWNHLKVHFNLETKAASRPQEYTEELIREIIAQHPPYVFTSRAWEKYRKEQQELKLPSFVTILRYIPKKELDGIKVEWYNKYK